jgi:signal peptidase
MTGTYDPGSVVYAKPVPVETLRVGDVITYAPPPGATPMRLVTHRIFAIHTRDGRRVFRTKGDAVAKPDPWTFTLPQRTQARVVLGVPAVGRVIVAFSDRHTRMAVIGAPALLIALSTLAGLAREWRRDRKRGPAPAAPARPGGGLGDTGPIPT